MAFIRTTKRAVLTREEINVLQKAKDILNIIAKEDDDGDYFCEIENRAGGVEWRYLADMIEELVDDCEQFD